MVQGDRRGVDNVDEHGPYSLTSMNSRLVRLFVLAVVLGGFGGFAGSVIGAAFGRTGLFVGGFLGGILIAPLTAWIAVRRQWVGAQNLLATAIGAAIGFAAAASIAVSTLSSPIGPLLSTLLIGTGAIIGARRKAVF